jgi:hypothetical protein
MLEMLALAAALRAATVEDEACRMVAEGLADNAIECPLFAHEVVSGEVQGVKERAIILLARMRPSDGRTLIIAVGGHDGARYFRSLGEWKGTAPTRLTVLPAGESEPARVRTVWDVLAATFSDGTRRMLNADGKSWVAIRGAAKAKGSL